MEEKKYKDFVIHDRRVSFEAGGDSPEQRTEAAAKETLRLEPVQENTCDKKKSDPLQELAFSGFILSLATTAQRGPGSIPNPQTNLTVQSLPTAKEMIDILGILKEKTKGNLTTEEQALFDPFYSTSACSMSGPWMIEKRRTKNKSGGLTSHPPYSMVILFLLCRLLCGCLLRPALFAARHQYHPLAYGVMFIKNAKMVRKHI
jgi:hypothetical protein